MLLKNVNKNVALHPVARAVALKVLVGEVRKVQLRLFTADAGSDVKADLDAAMELVSIVMAVLERGSKADSPEYRVMAGSVNAMMEVARAKFVWNPRHAVAIDQGLVRAVELAPTLSYRQVAQAWRDLHK